MVQVLIGLLLELLVLSRIWAVAPAPMHLLLSEQLKAYQSLSTKLSKNSLFNSSWTAANRLAIPAAKVVGWIIPSTT